MAQKSKRVLLIWLPFCTPATPPYSITYLYSFLKSNCSTNIQIEVLDLNLEFHKFKFPEYGNYYQNYSKNSNNWKDYEKKTSEYAKLSAKTYSENNKKILNKENPEFFNQLLDEIKEKKPDVVAFSIVYSSQVFYAYSLISELKKLGIKTIIGGPSANQKLISVADKILKNEIELVEFVNGKKKDRFDLDSIDFSIHPLNDYFTPKPVIPIKTSSSCCYRRCAFCSHFSKTSYYEFDLNLIRNTIVNSKQKYFFLIDDMIPVKRLSEIAKIMKPLKINWTCQLKPTKDLSYEVLKTLKESGVTMIMWGVESGNDRILKLMRKGTNKNEVQSVLENSHKAGILNIAYILFGFPTETKEEFLDTINFLKTNEENIDLVSTSIFGLQRDTYIYKNPKEFCITKIIEEKRTVLEPKISYEVSEGLTQEGASKLRQKYKKTIESINKYPKSMNFFREHMFIKGSE